MEAQGVILISDEEDDGGQGSANDSVLIVEPSDEQGQEATAATSEVVDDDLLVTFSRKATVMPHARYDCSSNPFSPTELDTCSPVENNVAFCEQCFCYICDKLASECQVWKSPGVCHCNAHKRSDFWKSQRNKVVLGYLHVFNFDLLEVDADLRLAERHLLAFECSLAVEYYTFLKGVRTPFPSDLACNCYCHSASSDTPACKKCKWTHTEQVVYNYSGVFQHISEFLSRAEGERPRTAAVMLLGATKLFIGHAQPPGVMTLGDPKSSVPDAAPLLLVRITNMLSTLLVTGDFNSSFSKKLQDFILSLPVPVKCRWLVNSVNVLPWDNPLLVAVLRGQNITGERHLKGKREVLLETVPVIQARVDKLREQSKYRELTRYLRVVRSANKTQMLTLRDRLPLYMSQVGDLGPALAAFFSNFAEGCCSACRLTPAQFVVYLRILATGRVPAGNDPFLSAQWESVTDARLPKRSEVIRWALRVLNCNTIVFLDPISWVDLIRVAGLESMAPNGSLKCASLMMPDMTFLTIARATTVSILMKNSTDNQLQIPKMFLHQYPDQALLTLVTQALIHRIFHSPMVTVLDVVLSFKENLWALQWFYNGLGNKPEILQIFLNTLLNDLYRDTDMHTRKLESSDHRFMGDFLAYCVQDPRAALYPVTQHVQDVLLKHWNGHDFPWQCHLRNSLQRVHELSSEVQQFLNLTQQIF
ncbi:uncharacterized protein [Paramormyrops kingsleyae]|uniref:uncharacterized protein isoform X2 n=1 Tax=Paramormyrops kingsleyae TaxID=1676925 RepID=UPI003B96EE33